MLFNSVAFLFFFLPALLCVFFYLGSRSRRLAATWLAAGSIFFYGWWNPAYVGLLLASAAFNYFVGYTLARGSDIGSPRRRRLLALGVACDLLLLGYYKYTNFFIGTLNATTDMNYDFAHIILPLGISFFTFTQIAFLVDAARGEAKEFDFIHYILFVTYFPHLIAGPILHHKEMMPQFGAASTYRFNREAFTVGLTVFSIGLLKKVVLADGVAGYATPVFSAAGHGEAVTFFQSWGGSLAYTMQLYFDFSGYSDMAIGLSYMIGVRLPINFNSPYKARNISDFWRRWHITLSRFLRDYLYIPLGGNRKGTIRRYLNLILTMILGGLWHGAGWTFVMWGGLHGFYLIIHHAWEKARKSLGVSACQSTRSGRFAATGITFLAVVVGWVFFRSESFSSALVILKGMTGMNGAPLPDAIALRLPQLAPWLKHIGITFTPGGGGDFVMTYLWIGSLLVLVFFAPNSMEIMRNYSPSLNSKPDDKTTAFAWSPRLRWGLIMAIVLAAGLLSLAKPSEFLYFQF